MSVSETCLSFLIVDSYVQDVLWSGLAANYEFHSSMAPHMDPYFPRLEYARLVE